jgi:hypothetical protein
LQLLNLTLIWRQSLAANWRNAYSVLAELLYSLPHRSRPNPQCLAGFE